MPPKDSLKQLNYEKPDLCYWTFNESCPCVFANC